MYDAAEYKTHNCNGQTHNIIGRLLTLAIVLVSSYACCSRYICYKGIGIVDLENSFLGLAARVCAIGLCHNQF